MREVLPDMLVRSAGDLLSRWEHEVLRGHHADPYARAVALGRLLRSGRTSPELAREARSACARLEPEVALLSVGCEGALDRVGAAIEAVGDRAADAGELAWCAALARDDLESVAQFLGASLRGLDGEPAEQLEVVRGWLVAELSAVDDALEGDADRIAEALAARPDGAGLARLRAVRLEPRDEPWLDLAYAAGAPRELDDDEPWHQPEPPIREIRFDRQAADPGLMDGPPSVEDPAWDGEVQHDAGGLEIRFKELPHPCGSTVAIRVSAASDADVDLSEPEAVVVLDDLEQPRPTLRAYANRLLWWGELVGEGVFTVTVPQADVRLERAVRRPSR